MGTTANRQKEAKADLDRKLQLSAPSRDLLEELAIACATGSGSGSGGPPSTAARFQYAFALSRSTQESELRYAVTILDGLVAEGYEHQVDCMYGAATALYLLGDYDEARVRSQPTILAMFLASERMTVFLRLALTLCFANAYRPGAKPYCGISPTRGLPRSCTWLPLKPKKNASVSNSNRQPPEALPWRRPLGWWRVWPPC